MVTVTLPREHMGSFEQVGCPLGQLSQNGHLGRLRPPFLLNLSTLLTWPSKRTPSATVWGPLARLGPKTAFVGLGDGGAVSRANRQPGRWPVHNGLIKVM
jgi:hypothetical protein